MPIFPLRMLDMDIVNDLVTFLPCVVANLTHPVL